MREEIQNKCMVEVNAVLAKYGCSFNPMIVLSAAGVVGAKVEIVLK